jgi:hypothetical protein
VAKYLFDFKKELLVWGDIQGVKNDVLVAANPPTNSTEAYLTLFSGRDGSVLFTQLESKEAALDVSDTDARALDTMLDEMAAVFRMGPWVRLRHVLMPQLAPYLAAAARSGLSLVWKIVLIVELLGRPNGVGFEIGVAFQLFDVKRILAYALAFVVVMLAIETLLVQPLERHVSRWRPRPA